ncbi:MAG: ATP-binding protein [Steroidobacteraceae bacterium]
MQSQDEHLAAARVATLYSRMRISIVMTLAIISCFYWIWRLHFDRQIMLTWFLALIVVAGLRLGLWWYWRRSADDSGRSPRYWEHLHFIGALFAGLSWSLGAVCLLPETGGVESILLLTTILLVSSVAVTSMSAHLPSVLAFICAAILPMVVALLRSQGGIEQLTALILVSGIALLAVAARQSYTVINEQFRSEYQLARAVDALAAARDDAAAASVAKSRFLAMMSHEIRTPLNGIMGMSELLQMSPLDAMQSEKLELLRRSGESLLEIVNDVLDFSTIEAGKLKIHCEPFELRPLCAELVDMWGRVAARNSVRVELTMAQSLPDCVNGDRVRLRQILGNLLSNSVKFTTNGAITLSVDAVGVEGTDSGEVYRFTVTDSGPGISDAQQQRLFSAFSLGDDSMSRERGGTGLGLAICQRLAQLMGGSIAFETAPGRGSRFWLDLPLARAASATPGGSAAARSAQGSIVIQQPCHVLLVEDNPVNVAVISAMLRQLGTQFSVVCDGAAAIEAAVDRCWDVILMDLQMPRVDGLSAAREIRRRAICARDGLPVPIIAVTANAFATDKEAAASAGMQGFLSKPMTTLQLAQALQACVTATSSETTAAGSVA